MGLLRNTLKRYIPSKLTSTIKQIETLRFVQQPQIEPKELFNQDGTRVKTYYLSDVAFYRDMSATAGRCPTYINWDRAHYNLPVHFYTDDMLFMPKGNPIKKYGMVFEPESLQPKLYDTILKRKEYFEQFDAIFTHSDRLLKELRNAKPMIVGGVYIGTSYGGGTLDSTLYQKKTKNISIVSSDKVLCELHKFRMSIAQKYEHSDLVDCFGTFNGGPYIQIWDSLRDYRYSFAIENQIENYWITERICNCFATMTVPIYLGSPLIGKYFNMDGIITIDQCDLGNVDAIVKKCNAFDYEKRIPAILDNYNRVMDFLCVEDWLCKEYPEIFV